MIEQLSRQLQFRVSVPAKDFWRFLQQFGEEFAIEGGDDKGRQFRVVRSVESYSVDWRTPQRMQVSLLLPMEEERRFEEFCQHFSEQNEIPTETPKFRDIVSDAIAKGEEIPTCPCCGHVLVVRRGAVFSCENCGETVECD